LTACDAPGRSALENSLDNTPAGRRFEET